MTRKAVGRRELLKWSGAASATALFSSSGAAQTKEILDLFGVRVPAEVGDINFNSKPLTLLRTIAKIVELEKLANQRNLPRSSLIATDATPLPTSEGSLYRAALPRLVTLIDRAEGTDLELADQAGSVLSDLNLEQRIIPDALKERQTLLPNRDFGSLKSEYASLFATTEINVGASDSLSWHIGAMRKFRDRYEAVGNEVKVPWYFIGAIHGLEASFNFLSHLHNGDFPLSTRTRQVPSGRPTVWLPPADWASSAKDALKLLGFTGQSDWSIERTLYRFEAYNGFGYRRKGVATPYLWSFSNHYESGKFVSDGRWNAKAKSQQCGAAVLIKSLVNAGDISI